MKHLLLSNGQRALVDDCDFQELSRFKWHAHQGYPCRTIPSLRRHVTMHEMLVGKAPQGKVVDHKNTNKLDNRRKNLRLVSKSVNTRNRQNPGGVRWHAKAKKWEVYLTHDDKGLYFGLFESKQEAASVAALLRGALIYHELTKGDVCGQ